MTPCPAPPPGLVKGSPGHQFALANVVLFPIFLFGCTAVFYQQRNTSVFLRKRSFALLVMCAIGTLTVYSHTAVYDYVGSEYYNCALFKFLLYVSVPAFTFAILLKVSGYRNAVAYQRLRLEMQGSDPEQEIQMGPDPLSGEASFRAMMAHFRVAFLKSKSKSDRILNAKFARSIAMPIVWFFLDGLPFFIIYFIRLGTNPQWITCTGCEMETTDALIILILSDISIVLTFGTNPFKITRHDSLRIVRECSVAAFVGGVVNTVGLILYLTDPGGVYAQGIFNYRWVTLFAVFAYFYVQSVHQVFLSHSIRRKVVISAKLEQSERFDEVMSDKQLREKLEYFMLGELSGEVLRFLRAVDDYKQRYQRDGVQKRGEEIFSQYIITGRAPYEVNLGATARNNLMQKMPGGNYSMDIFDEAYNEVKKEFLRDGFSRFLRKLEEENAKPPARVINSFVSTPRGSMSLTGDFVSTTPY